MYLIEDDMKNESRRLLLPMIASYAFALAMPLAVWITDDERFSLFDLVFICIFCVVLGSVSLYHWLCSIRYKLVITQDAIRLRTLFEKAEINIKDITRYTCKKYRKSEFYHFQLFMDDKRVLVVTRYKDKFVKLLGENNIVEQQG